VAALVFFSMAISGPLPALEGAEGDEEAEDGDREEVDDRARVEETAGEAFGARLEAEEPEDVAEEAVDPLGQDAQEHQDDQREGGEEEGDDLALGDAREEESDRA